MRAQEPDLGHARPVVPTRNGEIPPQLVDRHRMKAVGDLRTQRGVREPEHVESVIAHVDRDAEGSDGIPDRHRLDRHIGHDPVVRKLLSEERLDEIHHDMGHGTVLALEHDLAALAPRADAEPVRLLLVRRIVRRAVEEPHVGHHAGERSGGVRATAEPGDVDLVPGIVVARDERVAADDSRDDAGADGAAEHLECDVFRITDAVDVFRRLHDGSGLVEQHALLLVRQPGRLRRDVTGNVVEELHDVRDLRARHLSVLVAAFRRRHAGLLLRSVPGSVRAEDDGLGHDSSSYLSAICRSAASTPRNESCESFRATVPANDPAAAAINGFVWNSDTPCVPTSTARMAADSAIDPKPLNQDTNLVGASMPLAGLGRAASALLTSAYRPLEPPSPRPASYALSTISFVTSRK